MQLVSKKIASGTLGISSRSLDRLIADGKLGIVKVGRLTRVKESEVTEFIKRNSHGGVKT